VTTLESFRVIAAVGAAAGVLGFLLPGLRGRSAVARQAGALAVTVASWLLLLGSLVSRGDLDKLANRLEGTTRVGAAAIGVVALLGVSLLLIRVVIRRPGVWFGLLAVALPFRVPISLGGDRSANLLVPLYWVIAIGLVAWTWGRARARLGGAADRSTTLDIPVAAFTAFSLASTWWSGDIEEATIKAVFFYIPFVILFRLVVNWWPLAMRPLCILAFTTIGMAALVAVVALGQYATRTIWWNDTLEQGNVYNRFFRANGIFYDPNILGRYLVVAIIAAMAYAWMAKRTRDVTILAGLAAVSAGGLVVTFSRSSALALMVGVALLAFRAFGWKRAAIAGVALVVLVGGPVLATNANVRDKFTSAERLAGTGEGRFRLVEGGIDLWKQEPVLGVGLGAFSERYRETRPRREQVRTRVFISHTAPLTVLAELGAVGFGLFLVLCGATLVVLARSSLRDRDTGGWAQWTILAILIGIFVHGLLYSGVFEDPYVWALLGAGAAIGVTRSVQAREATQTLPAAVAPVTAR
jgi:O-antigen ligase